MNPVFADVFYFLAFLNPKDAAHARGVSSNSRHCGSYRFSLNAFPRRQISKFGFVFAMVR
jgi:hypothetical protein